MDTEILIQPGYGEVRFSGSLDPDAGQELLALLDELWSSFERPEWHLQLQDADLPDGRSLTALLDCLALALARGTRLQLTGLSSRTRMLLRISRLDSLFELEPALQAA